jgi:uncharacterized membrane protein
MPLELQVSLIITWIGADDVPVFAFFAGLLVFATIGVIQMIRVRTKWTWRHIVKDTTELLLAAFVTIVIAGVASYVSARIADRLGLNDLEANYLNRAVGSAVILGAWFAWAHLRIRRHRDQRSLVER